MIGSADTRKKAERIIVTGIADSIVSAAKVFAHCVQLRSEIRARLPNPLLGSAGLGRDLGDYRMKLQGDGDGLTQSYLRSIGQWQGLLSGKARSRKVRLRIADLGKVGGRRRRRLRPRHRRQDENG